jgi:6-pyruvoyltetrahydropterin/6-carboxytetrahydropterin synthase
MQITRKIVFHSGHMLKDDESKCHNPHGHEYVLEATIEGDLQKEGSEAGMVMHFGNLKEIMMEEVHDLVDHKFIVQSTDPRFKKLLQAVGKEGLVVIAEPPTAETLARWFYSLIWKRLPGSMKLTKVRLQETVNCWAEYYG